MFARLYTDPDPTTRFLVADEVGLGKTLVARGVIAKALEYLRDRVERIDVTLHHVWIEAQFQQPPPPASAPKLPKPPPPDQVNHLQYAIEWFGLAAIPLVGWPIVLRRVARRRR